MNAFFNFSCRTISSRFAEALGNHLVRLHEMIRGFRGVLLRSATVARNATVQNLCGWQMQTRGAQEILADFAVNRSSIVNIFIQKEGWNAA